MSRVSSEFALSIDSVQAAPDLGSRVFIQKYSNKNVNRRDQMACLSKKDPIKTIGPIRDCNTSECITQYTLSAVSSDARQIDSDPIIDNRGGGR